MSNLYLHSAASAQGPRRYQQDRWLCNPAGIFAVADGMGGHASGDVAAEAAIGALCGQVPSGAPTTEAMAAWFAEADRLVLAMALPCRVTGTSQHKMSCYCPGNPGTTLTALWAGPQGAVLGHSGDSMCWRVREGRFELLTALHRSLFGSLAQAIGHDADPQILALDVAPGDLFILHTDGLDVIHPGTRLYEGTDDSDLARLLVDAALAAGAQDNVTVVTVRVREG